MYGNTCINVWEAESPYVGEGRDMLMDNFDSIFWPCKARDGMRSPGGALYWIQCIEAFTRFVAPNSQDSSMFAALIPVLARDLYLQIIKSFQDSTVPVDEARKQIKATPAQEPVRTQ